jgi:hypothetical protein
MITQQELYRLVFAYILEISKATDTVERAVQRLRDLVPGIENEQIKQQMLEALEKYPVTTSIVAPLDISNSN